MNIKLRYLIAFFCIIITYKFSYADIITYSDVSKKLNIGKQIKILEDKTGLLEYKDVLLSKNFEKSVLLIPNLGISKSVFWIKIDLKNCSNQKELLLEIANPMINEIELYYQNENSDTYSVSKMGDKYKFETNRILNHQNYIFKLRIPKNQTNSYYLRVYSEEEISLPITIGSTEKIVESLMEKDNLFFMYFGLALSLIIYNLFILIITKDQNYVYYILYILSISLTQIGLQGYSFKYFWPNSPMLASYTITLFPAFTGFAVIAFFKNLLGINRESKVNLGFFVIIFLYSLSIFSNIILNNQRLSYIITDFTALIIVFYIFIISIIYVRKGSRLALFFLFGWAFLFIGIICFVLKNHDILPHNNFTSYAMYLGSAIEALIFSFALGDKINFLKKRAELNEKQLDIKVKERTQELEVALTDLKNSQAQLVNTEKMSSLGQLTAGVAHEINNPINFVTSNINPLRRDIEDLQSVMQRYESLKPNEDIGKQLAEIEQYKKKLDIDYVNKEINTMLNGIHEGARRTAEIVKGLRHFSRVDEDTLKKTNIIEGLNSTLTLLNNVIRDKEILVERNYPEVLEIDCQPGKLNQLFMNVMNNAIHAMEEKEYEKGKTYPTLSINATIEGEYAIIAIKDNGKGMSEEIRKKVFEPFFTTKPVGKGTGLGMAIVHTIIEEHKANVEIKSTEGVGTEFIFTFPVKKTVPTPEEQAALAEKENTSIV